METLQFRSRFIVMQLDVVATFVLGRQARYYGGVSAIRM